MKRCNGPMNISNHNSKFFKFFLFLFHNVMGLTVFRRTQLAVSGGAGDSTPHDAVQYFTPKHLPDQEAKYKSTLRSI